MRALVTGGAGFIGSHVVELLMGEGVQVVVVDDMSTGKRSNLDGLAGVEVIEGDIRVAGVVGGAALNVDVIFHLAASVGNHRSILDPLSDAETNVIGTVRVLEAARKAGVGKVVYSSSAGIFGELKHPPIGEDHRVEPDSPYGATKLAGEKLCLAYDKIFGIETVCLRYFNVYGPRQRYDAYGNVIPIFVGRALRGEPIQVFGDGEQTRDFVSVHDVARANVACGLTKGVKGTFNLGSGAAMTINQVAAAVLECTAMTGSIEYLSPRPFDVRHSLADIRKARDAFGYAPKVDVRRGIAEYVQWARGVLR